MTTTGLINVPRGNVNVPSGRKEALGVAGTSKQDTTVQSHPEIRSAVNVVLYACHLVKNKVREFPIDDAKQGISYLRNLNAGVLDGHPHVREVPGQHTQTVGENEHRRWFREVRFGAQDEVFLAACFETRKHQTAQTLPTQEQACRQCVRSIPLRNCTSVGAAWPTLCPTKHLGFPIFRVLS
jgi:hypothetical protein